MKLVSVVTQCRNEEDNVYEVYEQVKAVFSQLPDYRYEHLFIDNASTDRTVHILREIAASDGNIKVILNARNFGVVRSPYYALLQASGDAVISLVADLQDPPLLIRDFLQKWEEGFKIVAGVKDRSEESPLFFSFRKFYYNLVNRLSDVELLENFYGFGLYDRSVVEILKKFDDPYPYFRGLICEVGSEMAIVYYTQPVRRRGKKKVNFYSLFDTAMLGLTNHSKVPLRLATMLGFALAVLNLIVAAGYLIYKLICWSSFSVGMAPIVIGLFFFASVQLFFVGIIGEYVGSIHTQVQKRPLVIEKERINF
ncbi:MAG: glycosyltransferase family 2 protein [Thermodesulfobacteriota bacterium]